MSKAFDYKNIEYLDLEFKIPDNYNLCKRITSEHNKVICRTRENYNHRIHSNSNNENFEQLNTIIDLLCNLSEKLKINLRKQSEPLETFYNDKITTNILYLKELLEDIHNKLKESNNLTEKLLRLETEIKTNNKLLEVILYGKQRT